MGTVACDSIAIRTWVNKLHEIVLLFSRVAKQQKYEAGAETKMKRWETR